MLCSFLQLLNAIFQPLDCPWRGPNVGFLRYKKQPWSLFFFFFYSHVYGRAGSVHQKSLNIQGINAELVENATVMCIYLILCGIVGIYTTFIVFINAIDRKLEPKGRRRVHGYLLESKGIRDK